MNRSAEMLRVLVRANGGWVSRREIFDTIGFALLNNAASELRADGFDIEHRLIDRVHCYRLVPAPSLAGIDGDAAPRSSFPQQASLASAGTDVSASAASPLISKFGAPEAGVPAVSWSGASPATAGTGAPIQLTLDAA